MFLLNETPRLRVFVSRPAVTTPPQRSLERAWMTALTDLGFASVVLQRDDYHPDPWAALLQAVRTSHGALVLGFRQLRVEGGKWRPETSEARDLNGWSATPWNHVEAGLALSADIPVLAAPEDGVTEGIFAPETWTGKVRGAPIDLWSSDEPAAHPSVQTWAQAIHQQANGAARTRT